MIHHVSTSPEQHNSRVRPDKAIGLMGGTFDPVHNGHLRAALEFAKAFHLSQVRLLPCHIPSHRDLPQVSAQHRKAMLSLAIADTPVLCIDEIELNKHETSFTISTLRDIRNQLDDVALYFVLGTDAFNAIETWKDWQMLFDLANFVVVTRPGDSGFNISDALKNRLSEFDGRHERAGKIYPLSISALDISSTQIRQCLKNKQSIHFLVPEAVENYIHLNQLYQ